jgi:hypothetical protein
MVLILVLVLVLVLVMVLVLRCTLLIEWVCFLGGLCFCRGILLLHYRSARALCALLHYVYTYTLQNTQTLSQRGLKLTRVRAARATTESPAVTATATAAIQGTTTPGVAPPGGGRRATAPTRLGRTMARSRISRSPSRIRGITGAMLGTTAAPAVQTGRY